MSLLRTALLSSAVLAAATVPGVARAAEAYDNCTGFIAALPAIISTQGVWCMDEDLSTKAASGNAIEVQTNNVTIDCNGFKLGNLSAGTATQTYGIRAIARRNVTVRGCNIRGFRGAIRLEGSSGGGHVVEDNRIEAATVWGLYLQGDNVIARRNQVVDIGGSTESVNVAAYGIVGYEMIDIADNLVSSVSASGGGQASGIMVIDAEGSVIRDNTVRGVYSPDGPVVGIAVHASGVSVRGNDVLSPDTRPGSIGIYCSSIDTPVRDNVAVGFTVNLAESCGPQLDNLIVEPPP